MKPKIIRVGFDLDGVILYNPVRIVRPFISFFKKLVLKKKDLGFYYPKSAFEKRAWRFVHKSSIFVAPGMEQVRQLVRENKIQAYVITARYNFLGPELMKWMERSGLDSIFSGIHYNAQDEQPHLFKERMIKKLRLHYFVEDNLDIVKYMDGRSKTKILWIYNLFDRGVFYPRKFAYLKKAIEYIKRAMRKRT